jgi:hypothetical protein
MDWYDVTEKFHARTFEHGSKLSSLPEEWQRELAALWRLEADVNNGAYLQFLSNWGRESYIYASQALKKIGAYRMAEIVDSCQALVDEYFRSKGKSRDQLKGLMPNPVIRRDGKLAKKDRSILPEAVVKRIYDLSYQFMDYPDDLPQLGVKHYRTYLKDD